MALLPIEFYLETVGNKEKYTVGNTGSAKNTLCLRCGSLMFSLVIYITLELHARCKMSPIYK